MILRHEFLGRRGWVFTKRYYTPRGWRVPHFVWTRLRRTHGRAASIQLSYLHAWLRR